MRGYFLKSIVGEAGVEETGFSSETSTMRNSNSSEDEDLSVAITSKGRGGATGNGGGVGAGSRRSFWISSRSEAFFQSENPGRQTNQMSRLESSVNFFLRSAEDKSANCVLEETL